jgi:hypothetical protein
MSDAPPEKPRRGGARAGAGRKAQTGDGGPLRRCNVHLDEASIAALTAYGDGGLSEGIRRAARMARAAPTASVPKGHMLVPIKITPEMIERGIEAHYGKRRVAEVGGAQGVSMTVNNTDWSGVEAMRNFWRGALSAVPVLTKTKEK